MIKIKKIIVVGIIISSLILLVSADENSNPQSTNVVSELRDPMVKFKAMVSETNRVTAVESEDNILEIRTALEKCNIEGLAVSGPKRYVVINDSILAPGERILPDSDIIIASIQINAVIFELNQCEVEYLFNTMEDEN